MPGNSLEVQALGLCALTAEERVQSLDLGLVLRPWASLSFPTKETGYREADRLICSDTLRFCACLGPGPVCHMQEQGPRRWRHAQDGPAWSPTLPDRPLLHPSPLPHSSPPQAPPVPPQPVFTEHPLHARLCPSHRVFALILTTSPKKGS